MGAEKGGTKGGGFFHLFDWNRKSRKKLFSNGSVSPESMKPEKRSKDSLPTARLRLTDEEEIVGVSSVKGSSDYSCASSVTDEEGTASRAPGVVARLMGLDSLPTSGVSEPSSTPFFDTRSLRDRNSQKRISEFYLNDVANRVEGYAKKPIELRSQKMPSSPIERFQMEALPSRSAKSLPMSHHKLLSPIKTPGFISAKNAAHIMEAAAKILDPGIQPSERAKISSYGSSSTPLKLRNSMENVVIPQSQRSSRLLESARTPVESTDVRYFRGQSLNRSWNGSEDTDVLKRSTDFSDTNATDAKGKGKSISLAIQAKVNVQKREGLTSSTRSTLVQKDNDECKSNQPFKCQASNQKNKQKKLSGTNGSGVLRQNNQKQNCVSSKSKLSSKQSTSNQHGRKVLSGDASSTRNRTANKLSNSRVGHRKDGLDNANFEMEELSSSNKDFPRKKRLIEGGFVSEKSGFADNVLRDRHQKRIQPNVLIDEHSHSRWAEDNRSDGADVVSFTFTSPLIKPVPGNRTSTQVVDKWEKRNMYCFDTHNQKNDSDGNVKKLSPHGLNVITGDALSLLLEQKLRELTSGAEPSYGDFLQSGSFASSSPFSKDQVSDCDTVSTVTTEHEKESLQRPHRDKLDGVLPSGISSTKGLVFGLSKLQEAEEVEVSSSSDARKEPNGQHPSPFSILEASFSNESVNSSDSCGSTDGSKCSSSIQAQNVTSFNSVHKIRSNVVEMELSDSATSTLSEASDAPEHCKPNQTESNNDEDLDYIRDIIYSKASTSTDSSLSSLVLFGETLDPLLFDKLDDKRRGENKNEKMRRKVLFDCVNECLDLKHSRYFRTGYRSWAKGVLVLGKDRLAKELYDEISGWKSMGDWMVDELVEKDMSSHLGRWADFDIEAFESGSEIEEEIVSSLIDEVISDCLIRSPCL